MTKRSNGYGLGLKNAVQTAFHGKRSTLSDEPGHKESLCSDNPATLIGQATSIHGGLKCQATMILVARHVRALRFSTN